MDTPPDTGTTPLRPSTPRLMTCYCGCHIMIQNNYNSLTCLRQIIKTMSTMSGYNPAIIMGQGADLGTAGFTYLTVLSFTSSAHRIMNKQTRRYTENQIKNRKKLLHVRRRCDPIWNAETHKGLANKAESTGSWLGQVTKRRHKKRSEEQKMQYRKCSEGWQTEIRALN